MILNLLEILIRMPFWLILSFSTEYFVVSTFIFIYVGGNETR